MPSLQLRDVAQAILRWPGVILLVVLGFVGPTLVFTLLQPSVYEASAKLMVGGGLKLLGVTQDSDLSKNDEGLQELTRLVVEAIDSRPVAEEATQRLGLRMKPGELLENLSVEQEGSTLFIQLSYKDADPERA